MQAYRLYVLVMCAFYAKRILNSGESFVPNKLHNVCSKLTCSTFLYSYIQHALNST